MRTDRPVGENVEDADSAGLQYRGEHPQRLAPLRARFPAEDRGFRDRCDGDQLVDDGSKAVVFDPDRGTSHPPVSETGLRCEGLDRGGAEIGGIGVVPVGADVDDRRDPVTAEDPVDFVEGPVSVSDGPDRGAQGSPPSSWANAGQMSRYEQ